MESDFDSLQRIVEIADLRSKGIQDTHFLNWTFQAAEDTPYVQMAKRYVNQWEQVKELPEVPGGYYVSFCFGAMLALANPSLPPAPRTHFSAKALLL